MYIDDLRALRRHLLAGGIRDGGHYPGQHRPGDGPRTVFEIAPRDYMPAGEMRIVDPDGYIILIGQLSGK